jgi:DeoR family galactitol utilization operon repressor
MFGASLTDRERELLDLLADDPGSKVSEMSRRLGVSEVTVRKNLESLRKKGVILRSHGGAAPAFYPDILVRQGTMQAEKSRIARKAASLVRDGDTIMLNSSTTGVLIVRYLAGKRGVKVVTNSTLVLPFARTNPLLHVVLVGEEFRPATEALVGPLATGMLDAYHARLAFVGTAGFSLENGITAHEADEAAVVKKLAERADTTILVADSSKWGKAAFIRFLEIEQVHTIITDEGLSTEARERLVEAGRELIIV